jgi:hypothetical protein
LKRSRLDWSPKTDVNQADVESSASNSFRPTKTNAKKKPPPPKSNQIAKPQKPNDQRNFCGTVSDMLHRIFTAVNQFAEIS